MNTALPAETDPPTAFFVVNVPPGKKMKKLRKNNRCVQIYIKGKKETRVLVLVKN